MMTVLHPFLFILDLDFWVYYYDIDLGPIHVVNQKENPSYYHVESAISHKFMTITLCQSLP